MVFDITQLKKIRKQVELTQTEFAKRAKEAKKLGFSNIIGTDKFRTLNEVIERLS